MVGCPVFNGNKGKLGDRSVYQRAFGTATTDVCRTVEVWIDYKILDRK